MKYRICRILITRRVYRWVCDNMDVYLAQRGYGVEPDLRAKLAQRIVHLTVIR